jgi:hypothetical protein
VREAAFVNITRERHGAHQDVEDQRQLQVPCGVQAWNKCRPDPRGQHGTNAHLLVQSVGEQGWETIAERPPDPGVQPEGGETPIPHLASGQVPVQGEQISEMIGVRP